MNDIQSSFYDPLELREPAQRDAEVLAALPGLLRHAIDNAPALAAHLARVEPEDVVSFGALAKLPVLHKEELRRLQQASPPFGGLLATPLRRLAKVFVSPGPILDPEGTRPDYWRFARALYAAGIRNGDLIHNSFAYHLTPAGSIIESAAQALGCPVIPAGTGQTEQQLRAIEQLRPAAYAGTPSFLKTLIERGGALGIDLSCLKKAVVSGEALPKALAEELRHQAGIDAYQSYGTADLGLVAYETAARQGLVVDEGVLVEIVRPGTGDPVPAGEVGELLVTTFNPDYPLVRFATGDLSAILPGQSPCGRTNLRLRGWLGRADQTTKIKGMFVYPSQVADVTRRHPEIGRARLIVERADSRDRMILHCEVAAPAQGLETAIAESLRAATSLRGEVRLVATGSLANDGKVIDDRREPS
jgi:phenylacetate-coenzyme A ligase PaaK-like adenylate-forming protein